MFGNRLPAPFQNAMGSGRVGGVRSGRAPCWKEKKPSEREREREADEDAVARSETKKTEKNQENARAVD